MRDGNTYFIVAHVWLAAAFVVSTMDNWWMAFFALAPMASSIYLAWMNEP